MARADRFILLPMLAALAACGGGDAAAPGDHGTPPPQASALERAAIASGAIADPRAISPVGLYQRPHEAGRDLLCLIPGPAQKPYRFGMEAVFGTEQSCRGEGTARRAGDKLILHFSGRSGCIVVADYEGDRIALPGVVDMACDALCSGRGSLAGVSLPRIGNDPRAAAVATDRRGGTLCGG
ncbi:hypothetical protein [Sphingobium aquiterrae]|uniref:hypothetical protein n=1 Tax=Sphingobium aquiterrae TaxID=2038656 RepID=UPI0030183209